jgi:hypothetical protein
VAKGHGGARVGAGNKKKALADKLVEGARIAPLEERLEEKLRQYGSDPEARQALGARMTSALRIKEKIEALIAGKPVGDTAKRRDWWRSPTSDPYKDAYSKASTAYTALNDAALDLVGWAKALNHYYEEYAKLVAQLPDPDMAGERKFRVPKHLEQVLMSGVVIINDEGLPEISPFAILLP